MESLHIGVEVRLYSLQIVRQGDVGSGVTTHSSVVVTHVEAE